MKDRKVTTLEVIIAVPLIVMACVLIFIFGMGKLK